MSAISYPKYVQPRANQVEHFDKLEAISKVEGYYADYSACGLGKSFPALDQCQKYCQPLFVVAPVSVIGGWEEKAKEYGVPVECVISYDSLRSTRGKQPKHGYLDRIDTLHQAGSNSVSFRATEKLIVLIQRGAKFLFDECHKLKNRSAQWMACMTIAHAVYEHRTTSSCGFLSGSMFDKPEHARQMLELFGILRANFMFRTNHNTGLIEYQKYGLGEVIEKARQFDVEATNEITSRHNLCTQNKSVMEGIANKLCYELLTGVILKHVGSVMCNSGKDRNLKNSKMFGDLNIQDCALPSDILNIVANYILFEDKRNGYFKVSPETEKLITEKVESYAKAIGFDPNSDAVDMKRLGRGVKLVEQIEKLKVEDIFERVSIEKLEENPKAKGVLFLNYTENIEKLVKSLKKYNPIIFYGQTKNRKYWINKFMTDPTARLFIANTLVGVGFEIDDQIGDEPRFVLMSPSYRLNEMHQAICRVFRENTKSNVWIRIAYADIKLGKHQIKESRIINAIINKSGVLKSIPGGESQLFPGEYEDEYEHKE